MTAYQNLKELGFYAAQACVPLSDALKSAEGSEQRRWIIEGYQHAVSQMAYPRRCES